MDPRAIDIEFQQPSLRRYPSLWSTMVFGFGCLALKIELFRAFRRTTAPSPPTPFRSRNRCSVVSRCVLQSEHIGSERRRRAPQERRRHCCFFIVEAAQGLRRDSRLRFQRLLPKAREGSGQVFCVDCWLAGSCWFEVVGLHLNKKPPQLKNKVNKLRRQYASFKKLLSQSGFGWDYVNSTVVVDDPSIWDSHIRDNNDWAKFKKDGFPQYPELCIVFGDTYATGEHAVGHAQDLTLSEDGDNGGDNGGGNATGYPEDLGERQFDEDIFTSQNTSTFIHNKHRLDRTPNVKRRRNSSSIDIHETCKAIQDMLKARSNQSESGSVGSQVTPPPPPPEDPYSISAVIDVLVNMNDLDQDLYNKAVERACVSAVWREAFIKSPAERRHGLLNYLV